MKAPLHWYEGQFLRPHHFQALQRWTNESFSGERRVSLPYPYGVVDARLSSDALENLLVRFEVLRVITPSGLFISYPENAELPPLEIKDRFEAGGSGFTVMLGVPIWYAARPNTVPEGDANARMRRLYRIGEGEFADENTGENAQPLPVRRYNARLVFEDEDTTDLETIPLLRVVPAAGEERAVPTQDANFYPPCCLLSGSQQLSVMVRDLSFAVEAARREAVVQMTRAGFSIDQMRGPQIQQMMRLRTLARYAARLPAIVSAPAVTAFDVYLELRSLAAELSGLYPDRELFDLPAYDHDNAGESFVPLAERIRSLIRPDKGDRFHKLPFEKEGRVFAATLSDEIVGKTREMFLGIQTNKDSRGLARLVEDVDNFKLIAKPVWEGRVRGVKLSEERHPPTELPSRPGLFYFRVERESRMWDRMTTEREVAVWWPDAESSSDTVALYGTIAEE